MVLNNTLSENMDPAPDEQTFRHMFEKHAAIMLLIDPDSGSILDANQAAIDFYGYPKSKLCSMAIHEINILLPEQVAAERQKALKEERNYFIFTHKLANGEERIVEVHSSPIAVKTKQVLFSIIHDVTVRKRVEDVMRMGDVKYKAIFDNVPVGIFQSTPEGRFNKVNPKLATIYGYDSPSLMVAEITDISRQVYVNPTDRLEFKLSIAEHGEVVDFIAENYRKDGSIIWTQTAARAEKDELGKILYYEGYTTDITARKQAEDALQRANDELEQRVVQRTEDLTRLNSELRMEINERKQAEASHLEALDRIQKIARRVPGVVYQYRLRKDGSSCFPFASEAINDIYRVSPEDVREDASKLFNVIHPDDRNRVIASIQKSAQDLSPWNCEYRVKFEDGTINSLYGNSVPQLETDGSVLWHGFISDITDRKQMENELQAQRDFATQIINLMGQGLTVTNSEGRFEFVNPAYAHLFGYETADLIGKSPEDVTLSEDHALLDTQRKLRKTGQTSSYESQLRRANGSIANVLITGVPRSFENQYAGAIAVITDLTERKQMEEALRESERFAHSTVDAIAGEIAILDETGMIVAVNRAWRELAQANATSSANVCEGANYLAVCDAARGRDAMHAMEIADGIRAVIRGEKTSFSLEYPCDISWESYIENRWFNAQITRFAGDGPIRVVVAHINITELKLAEKRLQQQNEYFSTLHRITLNLLDHSNINELLQRIVDRASELLDAPYVELMLEKDGELVIRSLTNNHYLLMGERVEHNTAKLCWQAFDTKQPVILDNHSTYEHRQTIHQNLLYAVADLPVLIRDKCIGVLALGRSQPGYIFSDMQIKIGMLFAQLVALVLDNAQLLSAAEYEISERKRAEVELRNAKDALSKAHYELEKSYLQEQQLARIDTLTGINNRRSLFEFAEREVQASMRYHQTLSMILFDVDHFKYINDTYGHLMGDQVLARIAQTVCSELRSVDVIGRYGGDEFIILLPQTSSQEALSLAERIHISVKAIQIDFDKTQIELTVSIGITQTHLHTTHASIRDGQADTVENIILRADQALYAAKRAGHNRTVILDPE